MSARNGDKSRFHRERKQKIAQRQRIRELLERGEKPRKPDQTSSRVRPGSVSA